MELSTTQVITTVVSAMVPLIAIISFIWKVATKNDVKSLKADTERDIQSLKSDTERDMESLKADIESDVESLKTDVREIRQGSTNQPTKNETRPADPVEELKKREEGDFTADEHENRTRS